MPRDGAPVIYEVLAPRVVVPSNVRVRLLRPRLARAARARARPLCCSDLIFRLIWSWLNRNDE